MTSTASAGGHYEVSAHGIIPPAATDTRGVDYVFSIIDGDVVSWFPGVDTSGGVSVGPLALTGDGSPVPQHIHVREPVHVAHEPIPVSYLHEAIPVSAQVECATAACTASLSYRTSTGLDTETGTLDNVNNGLSGEGFTTVAMSPSVVQDLGTDGALLSYTATIPADAVDTNGVDYFVHVTDGYTNAWFPGTSYAGSVAPVDGTRTGWVHVEVFSRPQVVHVPPGYYVPGAALQLSAAVTSATGFPRVTLLYREGNDDGFVAVPMTVRQTPVQRPEGTVYTATGGIPASYTAQGGTMFYAFAVDDGNQTTYSPLTAGYIDSTLGYIAVAQSSPL